jgi:hypothetical protein
MNKYFKKVSKFLIGSSSQESGQIGSNIGSNSSREINSAKQNSPSDSDLRSPLFQPSDYNFPQRDINDKMRRFNKDWLDQYNT